MNGQGDVARRDRHSVWCGEVRVQARRPLLLSSRLGVGKNKYSSVSAQPHHTSLLCDRDQAHRILDRASHPESHAKAMSGSNDN